MNYGMTRTPTVSVVMSVLNGEVYLAEAIESILSQSFGDFELIIINDGSVDGSGAILELYRKKDERVQIYSQENRGLVSSLNRGCGIARGKYIARMDADDVAMCDRLMLQVAFMENHPEIAVLGSAVEIIDGTGKTLETHFNPEDDTKIKAGLLRGDCPFWHPTILMRTNSFVSTGGYREIVIGAEDHDLWLRIADRNQLANLRTVLLKYRLHPGQVTVSTSRRYVFSCLAALAAAEARRQEQVDPLDSVNELTPELLRKIGVSQSAQNAALARRYLRSVRTMCQAGQYALALHLLNEVFQTPEWKHTESRLAADLCLLGARALWNRGNYVKSVFKVGQAFAIRPLILGRPAKSLFRNIRNYLSQPPAPRMQGL